MRPSKNARVQKFLEETDLIDPLRAQNIIVLRELILDNQPGIVEKIMYGGIIFSLNGHHFSGLFMYKNHISIEFGNGYLMSDPNNILEGGGKFRRHLKIKSKEEISNKCVDDFIKQAINWKK